MRVTKSCNSSSDLTRGPGLAIYTIDKQPFHQIPEGLRTFERLPG